MKSVLGLAFCLLSLSACPPKGAQQQAPDTAGELRELDRLPEIQVSTKVAVTTCVGGRIEQLFVSSDVDAYEHIVIAGVFAYQVTYQARKGDVAQPGLSAIQYSPVKTYRKTEEGLKEISFSEYDAGLRRDAPQLVLHMYGQKSDCVRVDMVPVRY